MPRAAVASRTWFRVENSADDPSVSDIHIIDVIGSWDDDWIARNWGYDMGVTARAFVESLAQLPAAVKTIRLHINSPGGDVQAGINIANALRDQQVSKGRTVLTYIEGMAASIASVIAMAGSEVHIGDNALLMIHNPWSWAIGNAAEMRKVAEILDTMRDQAVATYRWHSSLEPEAIVALMDAETWMDADAAIAQGFATHKVEGLKAAASINPIGLMKLNVPEQFKARVEALREAPPVLKAPASAADILRLCKANDCLELAEEMVNLGYALEDVTATATAAKAAKTAEANRVREIRSLCALAKVNPRIAEDYIRGGMTVDAARAQLVTITAMLDSRHIDTALPADGAGSRVAKDLNPADIYAARASRKES